MHVFVTGATGLIGRALSGALLARGHVVTALSRAPDAASRLPVGVRHVQGDPASPGRWEEELGRADVCVNLAGEPVVRGLRWSAEKKRRIAESRIRSTERVAAVIASGGPSVLVSGSAVGFYGSRGDEALDERSPAGKGFLSEVCVAWEAAAAPARARAQVVLLRTGVVLARDGGALPKLVLPFKLFGGGPVGDPDAFQPWIHLADEVGLILLALEDAELDGPLDATAPAPVRQRELAKAIGRVLGRPSFLPAPAVALRLALGEMAEVVLASQRVLPRKALERGYRFRFPEIEGALRDLLG
jgi:uncharacterized protein